MPAEAELARNGLPPRTPTATQHVLAEPGDHVHRPLPGAPRRPAHPHRRRPQPDPRNLPAVLASVRHPSPARAPRGAEAVRAFAPGRAARRTTEGGEPELAPETPNLAGMLRAPATGRVPGQVAPDQAARPPTDGAGGTPSRSRPTSASPGGGHPTPVRPPRPSTSAVATPAPAARAGTRTTAPRPRVARQRATSRSPSAWSSRWSTRTTCSATRPPTSAGATRAGLPRPRRRAAADGRRGPLHQAHRPHADADGHDRLPRARCAPPGAARLRQLLRPPPPGGRRKIGRCSRRSGTPGSPTRCARGPSSSAAPTTARWASPTAGCARRCSTPTRRRSTSRSSSPTRCYSRGRRETGALASLVDMVPTLATLGRRRARRGRQGATSRRSSPATPRPSAEPPRAGVDLVAVARASGPARLGPGRGALHLRRPPGGHRDGRTRPGSPTGSAASATAAASTPCTSTPRAGARRVRDVRPRARPRRARQPPRRATGEPRSGDDRGLRDELRERLETAMADPGTALPGAGGEDGSSGRFVAAPMGSLDAPWVDPGSARNVGQVRP